jgi:undecaprenyl-diphosphatase
MQLGIGIVLLLAAVQGLTEFFPVSSSGHLVILESLLHARAGGIARSIVFEVAVHVGTLGAVIVFYRRKVGLLARALLALLYGRSGYERHREELRYIGLLIVGTIPAGAVGATLHDRIEGAFNAPDLTALLIVATGIYLFMSRLRVARWRLTWYAALIIGLAQGIAVLPGCSRSGWTITTGLLVGLGFAEAAEFSFLLSIPAVLGATVLELLKEPAPMTVSALAPLVIGAVGAFLAGVCALKLLIGILGRGTFHRFAYYCIVFGAAAFVYFAFLA